MFKKRVKKHYPPGTFIPTPARVIAIIQLCIAFTAILWNGGVPFMERLFQVKSQVLLYDHVLSQSHKYVSDEEIQPVRIHYEKVKKIAKIGFWDKLRESFRILLFELHPYEKAWIFFSVLIPILLLKKVEGAQYAVWILPLVVGVYCVENSVHGTPRMPSKEVLLFPKEEYLIKHYLKEPLSQDILAQHDQLQKAWNMYLIQEWAKETPKEEKFQEQIKKGDFFFTLERIKNLPSIETKWREKHSIIFLGFHFLWHLLVAWVSYRALKRASKVLVTD